ncbi:envelope glycoprotein, partial [Stygiomarasmius scandens]
MSVRLSNPPISILLMRDINSTQDSPYGYIPNFTVSKMFLALFGITTALHLGQCLFYRRWFLLYTVILAGGMEIAGWYGRFWSSRDVTSDAAFSIQSVFTIVAPTPLLAANF